MDRNFERERSLLQRINTTRVDGVPIAEHSYMSDEAMWQSFQQFLVDAEIREYIKAGSYAAYERRDRLLRQASLKACLALTGASLLNIFGALWLIISRRKVLVFSVDKASDRKTGSDFRLSPLYQALAAEKVRFVECFHTIPGKRMLQNFLTRRRPALYLEGVDALWYLGRLLGLVQRFSLPIEPQQGEDGEFVTYVIQKYMALFPMQKFRTDFLDLVLRCSAVQLMIGVDDARHYHSLVEACRRRCIRSVVLQHGGGHFSPYHPGWHGSSVFGGKRYMRADTLVVWSPYWVDTLTRLGSVYPKEAILIGGAPSVASDPFAKSVGNTVLVPHETESNKAEVSAYLRALVESGATVYFKIRPDLPKEMQCAPYDVPWDKIVVVSDLKDTPRPTLVVGVYSTFLYDMIALRIPVVRIETSMQYGESLLQAGLAETLSLNDVPTAVVRVVPETLLEERRKLLVVDADLIATLRSIIQKARVH